MLTTAIRACRYFSFRCSSRAELRRIYAEGHAVGYAESYVKGVGDALADRGPLDDGGEYRNG